MDITNYHVLGFDLDFTFAQYQTKNVTHLLHHSMTEYLIKNLKNFPENEVQTFSTLSEKELELISYKGMIYDAQNGCYIVCKISEDINDPATVCNIDENKDCRHSRYRRNSMLVQRRRSSVSPLVQSINLGRNSPSQLNSNSFDHNSKNAVNGNVPTINLLDKTLTPKKENNLEKKLPLDAMLLTPEAPQKTALSRMNSNQSENEGSIYSDDSSLMEDFDIPSSTTCKVVKIIKGFDEKLQITDPSIIKNTYKNQNYSFFKRLVNKTTICKNWHPKEKMMFSIIENNFEYGVFSAHLKLLELYYENKLENCFYEGVQLNYDPNSKTHRKDNSNCIKKITEFWRKAIEEIFGNHTEGRYYKTLYKNPEKYLQKMKPETLMKLERIRDEWKIPLFLATNSPQNYSKFLLNYTIGPEWYKLFELVLFRCKKPSFFTLANPFQALNKDNLTAIKTTNTLGLRSIKTLASSSLNDGFYAGGNSKPVSEVFMTHPFIVEKIDKDNLELLRILYFGDSLVSDVAANTWDSCYLNTDVAYPEWVRNIVGDDKIEVIDGESFKNYHLIDYVRKYYANCCLDTIDDLDI